MISSLHITHLIATVSLWLCFSNLSITVMLSRLCHRLCIAHVVSTMSCHPLCLHGYVPQSVSLSNHHSYTPTIIRSRPSSYHHYVSHPLCSPTVTAIAIHGEQCYHYHGYAFIITPTAISLPTHHHYSLTSPSQYIHGSPVGLVISYPSCHLIYIFTVMLSSSCHFGCIITVI